MRVRLPPDFLEQVAALRSTRIVVGHFFYPVVRLLPGAAVATVVRDPVERSISVWEYLQWETRHPDHRLLGSRGIRSIDEFAEDSCLAGHVRDNQTRLLGIEYDIEVIVAALEAGEISLAEARHLTAEAESAPADAKLVERAKQRLREMAVVGVTEELPEFVSLLESRMGFIPRSELRPDNASPAELVARRGTTYDGPTRERLADINAFDAELYSFARGLWESRRDRVAATG